MKKLFYGLGAVAAVVTPVVAVVSCGKTEVKKTGNAGVITSGTKATVDANDKMVATVTPVEKFETALNNVVSYIQQSESLSEDKQAKSIFIHLGILGGIADDWLMTRNADGTWNNSFRQMAIDLFKLNGVNMTSWTDTELDNFIKNNLEKRTAVSQEDVDQAWNDLYGLLADQSSELATKIENKDVEYAKTLSKDVVKAELQKTPETAWGVDNAGYTSLDEYIDSVFASDFMAKLELVSKGNSVEEIPLKNLDGTYTVDKNGVRLNDIVREHANLSIDHWVEKLKSLFVAYTGGKVDVFHEADSIVVSSSQNYATNNPRTPMQSDVLKTFKFDGVKEK